MSSLSYALGHIEQIPHNASAWNYLRGLHKHFSIPYSSTLARIEPYVTPSEGREKPVPFAVEWKADVEIEDGSEDALRRSVQLLDELADKWDVMRRT